MVGTAFSIVTTCSSEEAPDCSGSSAVGAFTITCSTGVASRSGSSARLDCSAAAGGMVAFTVTCSSEEASRSGSSATWTFTITCSSEEASGSDSSTRLLCRICRANLSFNLSSSLRAISRSASQSRRVAHATSYAAFRRASSAIADFSPSSSALRRAPASRTFVSDWLIWICTRRRASLWAASSLSWASCTRRA